MSIHESRALRMVLGLLLAVLAALALTPTVAVAATVDADPVVGVDWFDWSNAGNVVLIVGLFIPVITAAITKKVASSEIKSLSTLLLSVIAATVGTLVGLDGEWAWREFGNAFLSAFVPAIATYYGFWKHSLVTRAVTEKTANFGVLGKPKTLENDTRPDGPTPADDTHPRYGEVRVDEGYGDEPDVGEESARSYQR